jgi:hypothetical protein
MTLNYGVAWRFHGVTLQNYKSTGSCALNGIYSLKTPCYTVVNGFLSLKTEVTSIRLLSGSNVSNS